MTTRRYSSPSRLFASRCSGVSSSRGTHPFAPPLKIVRAHYAPAVERNAPVLSPFLRKRVVLEIWLGRRATEPIEQEFIRAGKNVGAVITDTEGNVAH